MNSVKTFLCLFLFFPCLLRAEEAVNTAVGIVKGKLPFCTNDTSLYAQLAEIGEMPAWIGIENSLLEAEQGGLAVSFFLDKKNGNWSVLTTDKTSKTCFVMTGKKWQSSPKTRTPENIVFSDSEKRVGYCAPFERLSKELSATGKFEMGFGFPDRNFMSSDALKATAYLFADRLGRWTAVAEITYKKHLPFACIESAGSQMKASQK